MSELVQKLEAEIDWLRGYVLFHCNCPCCNKDDVCSAGCSFAEEHANDYTTMEYSRAVLRGGVVISKEPEE